MNKTTVFALALLSLAGCSRGDLGKDASDDKRVAQLEARVTTLEAKVSAIDSDAGGGWILWQHRTPISSAKGIITGLAPANPVDAFGTKDRCVKGAWKLSTARSPEQMDRLLAKKADSPASAASVLWYESDGPSIDRVSFSCLPRGVTPKY